MKQTKGKGNYKNEASVTNHYYLKTTKHLRNNDPNRKPNTSHKTLLGHVYLSMYSSDTSLPLGMSPKRVANAGKPPLLPLPALPLW